MGDQETGSCGGGLKRQHVWSFSHQKKPLMYLFQCLILLCLLLILCYTLFESFPPLWVNFTSHKNKNLINLTNKFNFLSPYHVHPKHTIKPNEIPESTESPTVPTTVLPTGIQYHQAYARNYHYIMDNTEVCKAKTPFLVLVVPVEPKNVAARDAIRQTWGKESLVQGEVVLTLFMLGSARGADVQQLQEKLKQENLLHHDLIQSDFMDTYLNLTIKTMVIMDWLATRCPTAAYAMKIDSDMFLNIENLVIMLKKPGIPKQRYLTGMLMWNAPVVRTKTSKWYVPKEMYPEPVYPTYTLGMGYVFSNDLPVMFLEVSKSVKPFNIEDAYIGACMKKLGLEPRSPPDPSQFKTYFRKFDRCEFSKIITYILSSSEELVKYWKDLKKPGQPCYRSMMTTDAVRDHLGGRELEG